MREAVYVFNPNGINVVSDFVSEEDFARCGVLLSIKMEGPLRPSLRWVSSKELSISLRPKLAKKGI